MTEDDCDEIIFGLSYDMSFTIYAVNDDARDAVLDLYYMGRNLRWYDTGVDESRITLDGEKYWGISVTLNSDYKFMIEASSYDDDDTDYDLVIFEPITEHEWQLGL